MIDTIRGYIITEIGINPEEILEKVKVESEPITNNPIIKVRVINMYFSFKLLSYPSLYKISFNGSLNKFIKGNNLVRIKRSEVKSAFDEISELFQIPFHNAIITRIDIGGNILLKENVSNYLIQLTSIPRFKKDNYHNETVNFSIGKKKISFYNKIAEMKAHKELKEDYSYLKNKNIIRYELKLTNRLGAQLEMEKVIASDLYQEITFNQLIDEWYKTYLKIEKRKLKNLNAINNTKGLIEYLASEGMDRLGFEKISVMVESLSKKRNFTPVKKSRMKKDMRSIYKNFLMFQDTKEVEELNQKIKMIKDKSIIKFSPPSNFLK